MKKYEEPEIQVSDFEVEDIITTSGKNPGNGTADDEL